MSKLIHGEQYYYRHGLIFYFIGVDPLNEEYGYFKDALKRGEERDHPQTKTDISWLELRSMTLV